MNIGAVVSICSVLITAVALLYTIYKDRVSRAGEEGKNSEILRGIGDELRQIKDAQIVHAAKIESFSTRLIKVEDSTKSAHKRIDGLERKFDGRNHLYEQ